jgi:hypothetical protein
MSTMTVHHPSASFRFAALAAASFLVIGLLAANPASADGGLTSVGEIEGALCPTGSSPLGGTAELTEDVTDTGALTIAENCAAVLDLKGKTLTIRNVVLGAGSTLTVMDSSDDELGELIARSTLDAVAGIQTTGATLIIQSGKVTSTGNNQAAGIGGNNGGDGGTVRISGGTVTAAGGVPTSGDPANGAGIGGGNNGSGGTVTISGGVVEATGGRTGAGIGGANRDGGQITISGGSVTAIGGRWGAGLGGGDGGDGGTVTISGGHVTATGGQAGAGIGGGDEGGNGGTVTISGGTVTATGGGRAAGIGGGNEGDGGTVMISGGTVTATGGDRAAGIGGGDEGDGGTVTISGGSVVARAGAIDAEAIGAGQSGSPGTLKPGPGAVSVFSFTGGGFPVTTITFQPVIDTPSPSGPSFFAPGGVQPLQPVASAAFVRADGSQQQLTASAPGPNQVRYEADGVRLTFEGGTGTDAARGLVANPDGEVVCEVCIENLAAGQVVEVWLFSTPRLVAAHLTDDAECQLFNVPLSAPLDGAGPVSAGVHTLQFTVATSDGREAVNVGLTVGGLVPSSVPAGEGPALPFAMIAFGLAVLVGIRRMVLTNA